MNEIGRKLDISGMEGYLKREIQFGDMTVVYIIYDDKGSCPENNLFIVDADRNILWNMQCLWRDNDSAFGVHLEDGIMYFYASRRAVEYFINMETLEKVELRFGKTHRYTLSDFIGDIDALAAYGYIKGEEQIGDRTLFFLSNGQPVSPQNNLFILDAEGNVLWDLGSMSDITAVSKISRVRRSVDFVADYDEAKKCFHTWRSAFLYIIDVANLEVKKERILEKLTFEAGDILKDWWVFNIKGFDMFEWLGYKVKKVQVGDRTAVFVINDEKSLLPENNLFIFGAEGDVLWDMSKIHDKGDSAVGMYVEDGIMYFCTKMGMIKYGIDVATLEYAEESRGVKEQRYKLSDAIGEYDPLAIFKCVREEIQVGDRTVVFIQKDDKGNRPENNLFILDAEGYILWHMSMMGSAGSYMTEYMHVEDGAMYFRTSKSRFVYRIDVATLEMEKKEIENKLMYKAGDIIEEMDPFSRAMYKKVEVQVGGRTVVFFKSAGRGENPDNNIFILDAKGKILWDISMCKGRFVSSTGATIFDAEENVVWNTDNRDGGEPISAKGVKMRLYTFYGMVYDIDLATLEVVNSRFTK